MKLVQLIIQSEEFETQRSVAVVENEELQIVENADSVYSLALEAIALDKSLSELIGSRVGDTRFSYDEVESEGRLLPPLDHPESSHTFVTGTGLTHLGSADARDKMHQGSEGEEPVLTDSMRVFNWGIDGGKPPSNKEGVQPEWFYKGDGMCVVSPGQDYPMPDFSLDGGEEPEIAGLYVVGPDGPPFRVGYALGNEFSDHVTEKQNYLYLAHSKLRVCSYGPELLIGDLPSNVEGISRIIRDGQTVWEKPFLSGEDNMSHTIANLEHHHFKYDMFRQPGDIHVHFFGTATVSFAEGFKTVPGDVFEIESESFGRPLRNGIRLVETPPVPTAVRVLY